MKVSNLVIAISAVFLLVSGAVQAQETYKHNSHNQNFISKRAYFEPVVNSVEKGNDEFEGATLERDEKGQAAIKNLHILRLNQLSKRSFY